MKIARTIAIFLLLLVGIFALIAGYFFMIDPSRARLHIPVLWLRHSPFTDFYIPGIILFIVNGIFSIITVTATLLRFKIHPKLISGQGLILIGWIVMQILILQHLHILHFLWSAIGVLLFTLGNRLNV